MESQTRHLLCKRFFELRAFLICKNIRIVNSPASHRLAFDLGWEIPYVTRDAMWYREEIEISNPLLVDVIARDRRERGNLLMNSGIASVTMLLRNHIVLRRQYLQHPRGMNRRSGENTATRDSVRAVRTDNDLSTESTLIGLNGYTISIRNDVPNCNPFSNFYSSFPYFRG